MQAVCSSWGQFRVHGCAAAFDTSTSVVKPVEAPDTSVNFSEIGDVITLNRYLRTEMARY